jgi:hypothetical protein
VLTELLTDWSTWAKPDGRCQARRHLLMGRQARTRTLCALLTWSRTEGWSQTLLHLPKGL